MNLKLYLRKVNGRFYMSLGNKGYKANVLFNNFLTEQFPSGRGIVTFTDQQTEDSIFKTRVYNNGDSFTMDFFDVNDQKLERQVKQCPSMFRDYDIPSEFYINYNPEW